LIDLHSHVLPGLDDGASSLDESLEIVAAAARDGITALAATPHVRQDYPTTADEMERALRGVRRAVADAGLGVDVLPGGEIAVDRLHLLDAQELARFGLGGNPRVVLIEVPYRGWPLELSERVFRLRALGIRPVLGHPERNDVVQAEPERLADVVGLGALAQVTAASLDGRLGRRPQECSLDLLERELVHLLASDAHAPAVRGIGMSAAVEVLRNHALGQWLTLEMPAALIGGGAFPRRPTTPRRRKTRLRLFGRH
jgi:protein-tyrosine phosphatase